MFYHAAPVLAKCQGNFVFIVVAKLYKAVISGLAVVTMQTFGWTMWNAMEMNPVFQIVITP